MTPHAQQHTQCNSTHTHKARQHPHKHTHTNTANAAKVCSCSCWWSWKRPCLPVFKVWKSLGTLVSRLGKAIDLEKSQLVSMADQGDQPTGPKQERGQGWKAVVCLGKGRPLQPQTPSITPCSLGKGKAKV